MKKTEPGQPTGAKRNSSSNPADWAAFTRLVKVRSDTLEDLQDRVKEKGKQDAFNLWMDMDKNVEKVTLHLKKTRTMSTMAKNLK